MPTTDEVTEARLLRAQEGNGTGWFIGFLLVILLVGLVGFAFSQHNTPAAPLPSSHVKVTATVGHGSATHIGGGLFVTAAHVVSDGSEVQIDGAPVEVLWVNRAYDIALLRGPADKHAATPLACVTPDVDTTAFAYGNPGDLEAISTAVRIAGVARELPLWKLAMPVDGALAPGMSGGGVIADGQLIGVTVGVSVTNIGGLPSLYGVGFIVPSSVVCSLMGRS